MNNYLSAADVSASGLAAERIRMQVIANNVANAYSTQSKDGGPYRRQQVVFAPKFAEVLRESQATEGRQLTGVEVVGVEPDMTDFPKIHDPSHPHADDSGYVQMPNVSVASEMVDMITASRSYEANVQALRSMRSMIESSISLLRNV